MNNLIDLEKNINSELTTKINRTEIKHNQIYLETDKDDLIDVVLFLKTKRLYILRKLKRAICILFFFTRRDQRGPLNL